MTLSSPSHTTSDADQSIHEESARDESIGNRGRTTAGKVTTAISILLIVALAAALLYEGYATGQSEPAVLTAAVRTAEIEQRGDSFYIPIEIRNDGDQTVEEVAVGMELLDGDTIIEEAEAVIPIISEAESVMVVFVVSEDPSTLTIDASITTYQIAED